MNRQRGAAMPLAMLLVVATAALSSVLLERSRVLRRDAATDAHGIGRLHALEGGLDRARHALALDPAHRGGKDRIGAFAVTWDVTRARDGTWQVRVGTQAGGGRLDEHLVPAEGLPRFAR